MTLGQSNGQLQVGQSGSTESGSTQPYRPPTPLSEGSSSQNPSQLPPNNNDPNQQAIRGGQSHEPQGNPRSSQPPREPRQPSADHIFSDPARVKDWNIFSNLDGSTLQAWYESARRAYGYSLNHFELFEYFCQTEPQRGPGAGHGGPVTRVRGGSWWIT